MNTAPGLGDRDRLLSALANRTSELDAATAMGVLNASCFCVSLDDDALARALEAEFGSPDIVQLVRERCPYAFSARPVFVSRTHLRKMAEVGAAVQAVVDTPGYRQLVLARVPQAAARHAPGAHGVFFGYDFHPTPQGLGLIEVNTNAGGAMLNAVLGRAHRACCFEVESLGPSVARAEAFEESIVEMFRKEWRLAGRSQPLQAIAIVDEAPQQQYLYAEFLLFQRLFERHGIRASIADPAELQWKDGALFLRGQRVELVYNRLTDFYLEAASSEALRAAYLQDAIVLTPHPQAHAFYADKRNLAVFSDDGALEALGVPAEARAVLRSSVPKTVLVDPSQADELWARRKQLFFKPYAGYGGRAAYRGDKLTQRVWAEIVAGGYVAQELVSPGERAVDPGTDKPLKFDLRAYVYEGSVQWNAARLYQGQTTNFRTPGGGFAPVYAGPL